MGNNKFLRGRYQRFLAFSRWCYAYQITEKRIDDQKLRNFHFWLPDFPMFAMEKGNPILYLSECNPFIEKWPRNKKEITEKGHIMLWDTDIAAVLNHPSTVRIEMNGLKLTHAFSEHYDVVIKLGKYPSLAPEPLKLVQWAYARGEQGEKAIEAMLDWGISQVQVGVFGIDYIRRQASRGMIGSVARLEGFEGNSDFQLASTQAASRDLYWLGILRPQQKPTVKYDKEKLFATLVRYVAKEKMPELEERLEKIKINGR